MSKTSKPFASSVIQLQSDAEEVTDAEEEIFILYSNLQIHHSADSSTGNFRGLGFVNSQEDNLEITFEIPGPPAESSTLTRTPGETAKDHRRKRKMGKKQIYTAEPSSIVIKLAQNKTALRSRKGDTGSVVWKASIDFAQLFLNEISSENPCAIFDRERLRYAHVLELGAGTGLLPIILSSYVQRYIVSDLDSLIPLINKNLVLNSEILREHSQNITVVALDWLQLQSAPETLRRRSFQYGDMDLLLIVDCIYHPSLIPPLVETINHFAIPRKTVVLNVMELRAEEVTREFLSRWLLLPGWKIYRLPSPGLPYVTWCGWKN